jgi:molecular chaperone GrpE (heat shock protein)
LFLASSLIYENKQLLSILVFHMKVMAKHGVAVIPVAEGDMFNPDLCEAMLAQPLPSEQEQRAGSEESDDGVVPVAGAISGVFLPGYSMHERVIRPAQVGVYRDEP